jgi:hypothetical protein
MYVVGTQSSKAGNNSEHYYLAMVPDQAVASKVGRSPSDKDTMKYYKSYASPRKIYYAEGVVDVRTSYNAAIKHKSDIAYFDVVVLLDSGSVSSDQINAIATNTQKIAYDHAINKEIRTPVYQTGHSMKAAIRVWLGASASPVFFLSNTNEGSGVEDKVNANSQDFLNYKGRARITFDVSIMTAAGSYLKLVAKCKEVALVKGAGSVAAGLVMSRDSKKPAKATQEDWNMITSFLTEIIDSGIPIHFIKSSLTQTLESRLSGNSSQRPNYQQPVQQPTQQFGQQPTQQFGQQFGQQPTQQFGQQPTQQQQQPTQQFGQQPTQQQQQSSFQSFLSQQQALQNAQYGMQVSDDEVRRQMQQQVMARINSGNLPLGTILPQTYMRQ